MFNLENETITVMEDLYGLMYDLNKKGIDTEFLWGRVALLVSPVRYSCEDVQAVGDYLKQMVVQVIVPLNLSKDEYTKACVNTTKYFTSKLMEVE
jgi:hypothetical protein